MTTWNKNPGGCPHMVATASINLELPYDTHSDYHIIGNSQPASIISYLPKNVYAPAWSNAEQEIHDALIEVQDDWPDKLPEHEDE